MQMKVAEVKVARKVWEVKILTNRYGHKFIVAKSRTIYDTVLEVHLERMFDGVVVAHEVNNNIIDSEELTKLRRELIKLREEYCKETKERNRW